MSPSICRPGARARLGKALAWTLLGQLLLAHVLFIFGASLAFADDCNRDWRRAEDCLRTAGFAQALGTAVGVIGVILINGMAVARLVLRPPGTASGGGGGEQPPVQYTLDIQTTPSPLRVPPDGKTTGTVHARVACTDPKVDTGGLTGSIGIGLQGSAVALAQQQDGMSGGYRYLSFVLSPPPPGQPAGDLTVQVSVYVEGSPMTASIPVEVDVVPGGIDTTLNPEGKNWLSPVGRDQVWIYAKVNVPESLVQSGAVDMKAVKDSIRFSPLGGGEWIPDNKPVESGEWMAWLCEFYDANAVRGGKGKPAEGFTVQVTAQLGEQP